MNKEKVLESTRQLVCDLDATTTHIVQARLNHDEKAEGKALFEMEGMIVAAQQQLTFLYDYIYKDIALTPDDIGLINKLLFDMHFEGFDACSTEKANERNIEVLRRFNEQRNKK
jgi:hypothetical protein